LALRLVLGWLLLYAGYEKVTTDGGWSAAGFLTHASTFPGLYAWFASPGVLPIVNLINEWGQIALGLSLILGFWTRLSARLAALMMILYYFPGLTFPYVGEHSLIVDDHIIYAIGYLTLDVLNAGKHFGLDGLLNRNKSNHN
jgi:thiosulfate dehydrogenase [quinone] large subunit